MTTGGKNCFNDPVILFFFCCWRENSCKTPRERVVARATDTKREPKGGWYKLVIDDSRLFSSVGNRLVSHLNYRPIQLEFFFSKRILFYLWVQSSDETVVWASRTLPATGAGPWRSVGGRRVDAQDAGRIALPFANALISITFSRNFADGFLIFILIDDCWRVVVVVVSARRHFANLFTFSFVLVVPNSTGESKSRLMIFFFFCFLEPIWQRVRRRPSV